MEIILKDFLNNILNIDDIIVVHYPNENYKFIGLLRFFYGYENEFMLVDMDDNRCNFYPAWSYVEKIGSLKETPALLFELGLHENLSKSDYKHILSKSLKP